MHDDLVFVSTRTMTQDAFAAWIGQRERWDSLNHFELLSGRVIMTPPAGFPHGRIENRIQFLLTSFVRAHALGEVFGSSQGFELPTGDTVQPDTAFVSAERWDAAPPPVDGKFLRVVPDLVVEILSTSTSARDRGEKREIYEASGVREYWLVDPRAGTITLLVADAGRWAEEATLGLGDRLRSRVLEGLAEGVAALLR
jgi:Uma2 family endonuclease